MGIMNLAYNFFYFNVFLNFQQLAQILRLFMLKGGI